MNLHTQRRRGGPTKVCNRCEREFPEMEFIKWYSEARKRMRRSPYCNECRIERRREENLRRFYGISAEEHDEMLHAQDGRCAVCRRMPPKIFVDHCHATGKVRGLLCINCNSLIGQAKDDVAILRAAIEYLERVGAHPLPIAEDQPLQPRKYTRADA